MRGADYGLTVSQHAGPPSPAQQRWSLAQHVVRPMYEQVISPCRHMVDRGGGLLS
jgi:hypothetical protein